MAFVLSKIVWLLARPSHLLILLLLLGTALLFVRRVRAGRALVALGVLLALGVTLLPVGDWVAGPLEARLAAPPHMPRQIGGIVVLGGALERSGDHIGLNGAGERLIGLMALAHRYPDAKIVYTGGSSVIGGKAVREADLARHLLEAVGFGTERVMFERESRNTRENAAFSRQLAQPGPDETWLLVTSAMHMPRSVASFRREGWTVIPYPVDFRVDPNRALQHRIDFPGNLALLDAAAKEWVGLAAYYWLGYTDALFPGPSEVPGPGTGGAPLLGEGCAPFLIVAGEGTAQTAWCSRNAAISESP